MDLNEHDKQLAASKKPHRWTAARGYEEVPYVHQEFPKYKYHATKAPVVVQNREEEQELGEGWFDIKGDAEKAAKAAADASLQHEEQQEPQLPAAKRGRPKKADWTEDARS